MHESESENSARAGTSSLQFRLPELAAAVVLFCLSLSLSRYARGRGELTTLVAMALCGGCLGSGAGLLLAGSRATPVGAVAGFLLALAGTMWYVLPRI